MSKPRMAAQLPEIIGPWRQPDPFSAVQLIANTASIDAWAEDHQVIRAESIRRLLEIGLKAEKL
jgi:hypothetical protein